MLAILCFHIDLAVLQSVLGFTGTSRVVNAADDDPHLRKRLNRGWIFFPAKALLPLDIWYSM